MVSKKVLLLLLSSNARSFPPAPPVNYEYTDRADNTYTMRDGTIYESRHT